MSTIERPEIEVLPALFAGERLDQPEFHRRYAAMPEATRAELVGGIVHMPSPLGYDHGDEDHVVVFWLMSYCRATRPLRSSGNATVKLGPSAEVQPDAQLRIPEELGGASKIVGGYVVGPPELVVEIAQSSRGYDLGPKKAEYEKAGVLEYLFIGIEPDEVRWFALVDGRYEAISPEADGSIRSRTFPGLWLDPIPLFEKDLDGLIGGLERGLASAEHARFAPELAGRRG